MYKIIALDMDGTLLNSQKHISPRTKEAITKARQQGIKIVLASGRPIEGMRQQLAELDIHGDDDYVLYYNGSLVENLGAGEIVHQNITDGKAAKKIARIAQKLGVNVHAFSTIHGLITPKNSRYTEVEATINGIGITELDFETLDDEHPIIKTMIIDEPAVLSEVIKVLPPELYNEFTIVQSAPYFLEFLNPASNKGAGLAAVAALLNVPREQIISMGDAGNDIHMLEYAGLGIAMDNAMDETKAVADAITASNDDDGVAIAIEKYALR
ncbi:Cof-type HAD-IIB family hydrolase [Vibrio zhugei]|uniref:Cof-type HAD-IIB family hydrolase n=1 Tax=Vibrio zhugei TaxID=2479546 RepID=A0ABV7C9B6_9VIBR|nr:Cof-type HAD-IIB family hydrolase [Vibrio zhugei]